MISYLLLQVVSLFSLWTLSSCTCNARFWTDYFLVGFAKMCCPHRAGQRTPEVMESHNSWVSWTSHCSNKLQNANSLQKLSPMHVNTIPTFFELFSGTKHKGTHNKQLKFITIRLFETTNSAELPRDGITNSTDGMESHSGTEPSQVLLPLASLAFTGRREQQAF